MTLDQAADRLHAVAIAAAERHVASLLRQGIDPADIADVSAPYMAELVRWYRDSWREVVCIATRTVH